MNELPISLKKTLKKAINNPEKSGKHKSLIDFSETLLVYVCSYIIGEYRKAGIETLEYEKLFFKNNKNLSTGTYQMFLREGLKTLSKSKVEIGISNIIIGKNEFSSISEFILAFDVLKKAVNNQTQEVYNELVTEELNKRNGNYSKTNVLTFFDSFIQLRNRVAHPHKEIKGVMIHWPSSLEYYEVVNNYLEKAIIEVCEKLEELWSFDEAKIVDDEGDESIVEVNKTGVQQELSGISFPKGTQLLIKNEKEWICISLKETLKVGPNIIESIEKEKQEAQRLESIEELKTHIETALDDGQISADELKFFESLGKNRLGLDAGKIKEVILEVANKLEIEDPRFLDQHNKKFWPELKIIIAAKIKTKTRDEWADIFDGSDACVAPVLSLSEAPEHHHMKARNSFVEVDGVIQPAPAPRFSNTITQIKHSSVKVGENNDEICSKFNLDRSCFS